MKRLGVVWCLILLSAAVFAASAPAPGAAPDGRKVPNRRNSQIWRAFSMLDDAKRAELTELQRKNPEEFVKRLQAIAEEQRQTFLREIAEQKRLIAAYRDAAGDEAREKLRSELESKLRAEFVMHLTNHRRMIRDTEKRLEKMREELRVRETNTDRIVAARLESLLSGNAEPGTPPRNDGKRLRGRDRNNPPPPPEDR